MIPDIATIGPSYILTCALHDQAFHMVITMQKRLIHVGFQIGHTTAAGGAVRSDDNPCFRVIDPICQCVRREAREDHGVDRADARAGKHGIGCLGDHRQIENNTITALNAQ